MRRPNEAVLGDDFDSLLRGQLLTPGQRNFGQNRLGDECRPAPLALRSGQPEH